MARTNAKAGAARDDAAKAASLENRIAAAAGLPPLATGLLVFGVLAAGFALDQWILGVPLWRDDPASGPEIAGTARVTLLVIALIGFTAAANLYLPRAIYRDRVQSLVRDPATQRELLAKDPIEVSTEALRRSRWAGLAGVAVSLGILGFLAATSEQHLSRATHPVVLLMPVLFWMLARSVASTLWGEHDAADRHLFEREIDLLDLRPHFVEGRAGLRLALVWLAGTAINVLILFSTGLSAVLIPLTFGGIAVGVLAFVLPVRGLQRRIRDKKRAALDALSPELHQALVAHDRGGAVEAGRLADLLALRAHLDGVREWPFDDDTLRRFALYTLIPLGSWLGGALVERLLGAVLG